jgi:hypothetical protein
LIYPGRNSTIAVVGVVWINLRIQRRQTDALARSCTQLDLCVERSPEVDHAHKNEQQNRQHKGHLDRGGAAVVMASTLPARRRRQPLHNHHRTSHLS